MVSNQLIKGIVVSDGETSIKQFANKAFPNAVHILDFFHLKRKVNNTFGIKTDDENTQSLRQQAIDCIDEINTGKLLEIIYAWQPEDKIKQKHKQELITYITNNLEQIKESSKSQSSWIFAN